VRLDLGVFGVMFHSITLVVSNGMHFRQSMSIITFTHDSPNDGVGMRS